MNMTSAKKTNVLEKKTKDFIQALTNSPEYQALDKARKEFESDEDAKKLMSDFQETQRTSAIFNQGNFSGAANQKKKLRELQHRLKQNQKINNLIRSQRVFQVLISNLVQNISREIDFPFSPPQTGGGCCG